MLTDSSFELIQMFLPQLKLKKIPELRQLFTYLTSVDTSYEVIEMNEGKQSFNSSETFRSSYFITEEIIHEISTFTSHKKIVMMVQDTKIIIEIIHEGHNLDSFIDILLYTIAFIVNFAEHSIHTIKITYGLSSHEKKIKKPELKLGKKEINSGSTDYADCKILIWRIEDILKVTIHELIHCLSYDYKSDSMRCISHFNKLYSFNLK